jgi:hypothetical protein
MSSILPSTSPPNSLKDNTHMWQRRRSPADHYYCAPLTPLPQRKLEMKVRRRSKKQHTTVSFYIHLPPPRNLDPEIKKKKKESRSMLN